MSAHYRLGIGVNAAFRTLRGWQELLRGVRATGGAVALRGGEGAAVGGAAVRGAGVGGDGGGGEAAALLRAYEEVVGSSAEQQAHRQLATIYFEALCGFLTFSDGHVYRRRRADRTLHELPMGTLQNINCTAAATHESRVAGTR